jgi:hypothetical protein
LLPAINRFDRIDQHQRGQGQAVARDEGCRQFQKNNGGEDPDGSQGSGGKESGQHPDIIGHRIQDAIADIALIDRG